LFSPHAFPGLKAGPTYETGANETLKVMVQIESKDGVANVEKIAQVPGLDVLLIGPFDLAKQLGVERGGDEHEAALRRILEAAHGAGKTAAIFCTSGEDARVRAEQGFDMVSVVSIEGALAQKMQSELDVATGSGETKVEKAY
jgi:4-hydroxy-2-oxoheptanedioate aldolase